MSTATTKQDEHRLAGLDGLRGLACLAIFVFHGWLYTMEQPAASQNRDGVLEYAVHELRLALVAFFVLSGFLLYRPWLRAALGSARRRTCAATRDRASLASRPPTTSR